MSRLTDLLRHRIASLFRGDHVEASLKSEIELHLQEQIDENVAAGMSPEEARAAARRAFGPVSLIEERCRDTRRTAFVETLMLDLRYSFRSLVRQPMLLAAAISSIAVAVGANTSIFSIANELMFARPSAQRPDRLVQIRMGGGSHVWYRQWRHLEQSGALAGLAGYNFETSVNWRRSDEVISLIPMLVTANFFDIIVPRFAMGRAFTVLEAQAERDPTLAVVTYSFWRDRLNRDPQVIGTALTINGRPYTVVGVLASDHRAVAGFGLAPEVYLPLGPALAADLETLDAAAHVQLVGRLRDGQGLPDGQAAIATAGAKAATAYRTKNLSSVSQFTVGGMQQLAGQGTISAFFAMLLIAVGLILAISCANVAGLLLSRLTARSREMAVRVAIGASRLRLAQQLLAEGFWLALLGTAGGLVLMKAMTGVLARAPLPLPVPLELHSNIIDSRLLCTQAC